MRVFSFFVLLFFSFLAQGQQLLWDRNPETNIGGYKVHTGKQSRVYESVFNVGNVTNFTLSGSLLDGSTNFYAVTAYDTEGSESDYSDEVNYANPNVVPPTNYPPSKPTGLKIVGISIPEPVILVTNGLIAHWKFDESSGIIVNDSSSNNILGTLINGPISQAGRVGARSIKLDGTNDYVNFNNINNLDNLTNFSVCFWYRLSEIPLGATVFVSKWHNSFGGTFDIVHSPISEALVFYVWTSTGEGYVSYRWGLGDLNWNHFVGVYNGSNLRIYFNGELTENTTAKTGQTLPNNFDLRVGSSHTGDYFKGSIDDVRIYNRPLNASEILSIYRAQ